MACLAPASFTHAVVPLPAATLPLCQPGPAVGRVGPSSQVLDPQDSCVVVIFDSATLPPDLGLPTRHSGSVRDSVCPSGAATGLLWLLLSFFSEKKIHDPATANVRSRAAAVRQDLVGEAAGVFQGIGQNGQQVEPAIVVDRVDKTHDSGGSPSGVGKHEAEGNWPEDAAEHPSLGSPLRLPDSPLIVRIPCVPRKTFGNSMSRAAGTILGIFGRRRSVPGCPGSPTFGRIRIWW